MFESLASYQWQCECASEAFVYPSPPPYNFHAQSPCTDKIRDACDHYSSSPSDACSYCQSFDHDVNSCLSFDAFNDSCARIDILMETIKEQQDNFVSKMREFSLLHETDPSLPIPRLESDLPDDYASSCPLESNVVDDAPLPDLEDMFDSPLPYAPLVAPSPSSTPLVTSTSDSTLLDSPVPLAQCTGLEVGETSGGDVRTLEDDSLSWSEEPILGVPHLEEAPVVECVGEDVWDNDTHSIAHIDPICSELFDSNPILSSVLPPTPPQLHIHNEPLGDIRGYNPSFDSYCAYLEGVPRKITWSNFFYHIFDFSMAFGVFKRPLTFIDSSFVVFSYLHHSEMHAACMISSYEL